MEERLDEESEFAEANADELLADLAAERERECEERDQYAYYSAYPEERKKAMRKLRKEGERLEWELGGLQERLEASQHRQQELRQQLKPLQTLQKRYTETQKTIDILQGRIDEIERRVSEIEKDLSWLQSIN